MSVHTFAAIYIGSYEVSIKIFEITAKKKIRGIDYVRSHIEMGRDAYSKGSIGYELVDTLCDTLAEYKKTAPRLIVGLYAYGLVISLAYNALVLSITSSLYAPVDLIITGMSVGTSMIINVAMVICNHIYFKKRKRLFNK